MFNVGGQEFLIILVLGLLVLGPDRLPGVVRQVGKILGEVRRVRDGFQDELRTAMKEPMEAIDELRSTVQGVKSSVNSAANSVVGDVKAATSFGGAAGAEAASSAQAAERAAREAAEADAAAAAAATAEADSTGLITDDTPVEIPVSDSPEADRAEPDAATESAALSSDVTSAAPASDEPAAAANELAAAAPSVVLPQPDRAVNGVLPGEVSAQDNRPNDAFGRPVAFRSEAPAVPADADEPELAHTAASDTSVRIDPDDDPKALESSVS
jgi:sec-independent protein translocase protein TatB